MSKRREDDLIKYYSSIPHIVDDFPLTPAARSLYLHIVRKSAFYKDLLTYGPCMESTRNLANNLNCSPGAITRAIRELVIGGLIKIKYTPGEDGEFGRNELIIVSLWKINSIWMNKSEEERKAKINNWKKGMATRVEDSKGKLKSVYLCRYLTQVNNTNSIDHIDDQNDTPVSIFDTGPCQNPTQEV